MQFVCCSVSYWRGRLLLGVIDIAVVVVTVWYGTIWYGMVPCSAAGSGPAGPAALGALVPAMPLLPPPVATADGVFVPGDNKREGGR